MSFSLQNGVKLEIAAKEKRKHNAKVVGSNLTTDRSSIYSLTSRNDLGQKMLSKTWSKI